MKNKNNENSIFKIAVNLTIACLISGIIIAVTYYITAPVAVANSIRLSNEAMQSLVKDAESFIKLEDKPGWYAAYKDEKLIAYIVPAESKGYGGTIKLLTAITPEGKQIDYTILSHNETPGLGDNTGKEPFRKQFSGKGIDNLVVVKDPSNKDAIQAVTGATISSKAVTKAVKEAAKEVIEVKGEKIK